MLDRKFVFVFCVYVCVCRHPERINKFMMMACDWREAQHRVPKDCGPSQWASAVSFAPIPKWIWIWLWNICLMMSSCVSFALSVALACSGFCVCVLITEQKNQLRRPMAVDTESVFRNYVRTADDVGWFAAVSQFIIYKCISMHSTHSLVDTRKVTQHTIKITAINVMK